MLLGRYYCLEELAASIFGVEDGSSRFLQSVDTCVQNYKAAHLRRPYLKIKTAFNHQCIQYYEPM
jgi:hypothetical protein